MNRSRTVHKSGHKTDYIIEAVINTMTCNLPLQFTIGSGEWLKGGIWWEAGFES